MDTDRYSFTELPLRDQLVLGFDHHVLRAFGVRRGEGNSVYWVRTQNAKSGTSGDTVQPGKNAYAKAFYTLSFDEQFRSDVGQHSSSSGGATASAPPAPVSHERHPTGCCPSGPVDATEEDFLHHTERRKNANVVSRACCHPKYEGLFPWEPCLPCGQQCKA